MRLDDFMVLVIIVLRIANHFPVDCSFPIFRCRNVEKAGISPRLAFVRACRELGRGSI